MFAESRKHIDAALCGSIFELHRANKLVRSKLKKCEVEQFRSDKRLKHSRKKLDRALATSVEHVQRIEDKARGTLLGVTVAVAAFGVASGIVGPTGVLGGHCVTVRIVAAVLLVGAMAYLFVSGIFSLQAYKIGELYEPTLFDSGPLVAPSKESMILLYCMEQNNRIAILRSNRLAASFSCLRSGLIAILLLGVFVVAVALLTPPA